MKLDKMTPEQAALHLKERGLLPSVTGIYVKRACRLIGEQYFVSKHLQTLENKRSVPENQRGQASE